MNTNIIFVLTSILPAIITGMITLFISQRSFYKNMPKDKIEISYNRVYYPIFKFINDHSSTQNYDDLVEFCNNKSMKYNKFFEEKTIILITKLKKSKEMYAYDNYMALRDNIIDNCKRFRKILGYPEPSVFGTYRYLTIYGKSYLFMLFGFIMVYISIIVSAMVPSSIKKIFYYTTLIGCFITFLSIVILLTAKCVSITTYKISHFIKRTKFRSNKCN